MPVYAQKELPAIDTAQDLRAIQAREFHAATPVLYLRGVATPQDGNQGLFEWQPLTFADDDGLSTFRPNWVPAAQAGRWVRLTFATTSSAYLAKTVSTDYAVGPLDYLVRVDASGAARAITLPPIATAQKRPISIKKIDSTTNPVTIAGDATIDGNASARIGFQNEAVTVAPNDQNTWDIL